MGGVVPFTATDYPGALAMVVFVQGCPWRCRYCHNPHLQARKAPGAVPWHEVMRFLKRREGLVDAVVFSGGEPTTDPALPDAISEVKALGFKTGLHSGGAYPRRFKEVLPLLDWVGLDVKASFDDYERTTQVRNSGEPALSSLEALLESGVEYECRTTLHPDLMPEREILRLAYALADRGVKRYVLQVFRAQGCADSTLNAIPITAGYPSESGIEQVSALFPQFALRRG
ncbi:anaerobic ribonucleoside-triphosphate reductase activating protein [Trinickia sp. YCB016]